MSSKGDEKRGAFDLERFLPYLLNQAAERTSKRFEVAYRESYGISRTQWRILAHLGSYGEMTAAAVSRRSHTEKSKLSRAVSVLEAEGLLRREQSPSDRRTERLQLTDAGRAVFDDLSGRAVDFDLELRKALGPERAKLLEDLVRILAARDE
ncbi:MarR family winged helix-turn-helix transcriptional regulator [Sphingomonas koreensis]